MTAVPPPPRDRAHCQQISLVAMEISPSELEPLSTSVGVRLVTSGCEDRQLPRRANTFPLVEWFGILDRSARSECSEHGPAVRIGALARAIADLRAGNGVA